MIVFLFHFSLWLTEDSGKADWWWNLTPIISSILFIATAPVIGQRLDTTRKKLKGLRIASVITFSLYLATALVTILAPVQALLATILFTCGLYFYLVTFIFYTPFINDISTGTNKGFVSGLGMAANYAGQVLGILAVLPFATGAVKLFGEEGRAQALLPAVLICGVLVLPMLLKFKETPHLEHTLPLKLTDEYRRLSGTLRSIFSARNLVFVLAGYFFYGNALLTFTSNFPIYLENVYAAPDTIKTYITAVILMFAAVGSVVVGRFADREGHKRTLVGLLGFWMLAFPLLAFAPTFNFAVALCIIGGFLFGPVWTISRAMIAELAPKEAVASSFSFYIISERFAALVGPFVWGLVLSSTAHSGTMSYNYAVLSMALLVVIGYLFIRRLNGEANPIEKKTE
jgi:UMF1 family MFS transporter